MKLLLLPLLLSVGILISGKVYSAQMDITPTYTWTEYITIDGVTIEYVFQECNSELVSNQTLVLFRYSNNTDQEVTLTWKLKTFRNNQCSNCDHLHKDEYTRTITLAPGEIFTGDCTSKTDKKSYEFSHFINKVPGMSDTKLTSFEFVDIQVITK